MATERAIRSPRVWVASHQAQPGKKSRAWIWLTLLLLAAGGGGYYVVEHTKLFQSSKEGATKGKEAAASPS